MPRPGTHTRTVERVGRLCDARYDPVELRLALLDEIRGVVAFDAYAWLLADPETEVRSAPLADVPCLPELPRLIRLKCLTEMNRWTGLDGPVGLLRRATDERPELSLVWRDLLSDYGVHDVTSLVFRDRFGCWGFLDLWRTEPRNGFTEGDARLLADIAPPITAGLRRAQALTFEHASVPPSAPALSCSSLRRDST